MAKISSFFYFLQKKVIHKITYCFYSKKSNFSKIVDKINFGVHGDALQGGARGCTPNNKHIKYILTKRATRAYCAGVCPLARVYTRERVDRESQALFLHSGRAGLKNRNGHLMPGHPSTSECLAK